MPSYFDTVELELVDVHVDALGLDAEADLDLTVDGPEIVDVKVIGFVVPDGIAFASGLYIELDAPAKDHLSGYLGTVESEYEAHQIDQAEAAYEAAIGL